MKKFAKTLSIALLSGILLVASVSLQKAQAYSPPYTNLRVGIYYGSSALPAANLQNVTGYGSGYQYGTLDANRQFVPLGGATSETKVSVLRDRNMVYDSSKGCYNPGSTGDIVVGCYHIQLNTAYPSYAAAQAAVAGRQDGFVKYCNGTFNACIGNYTTADAATVAMSAANISGAFITSGSSSTVTVVKTGTNTILFEFEYGSTSYLVIMPTSSGVKCQTWFKGFRYYGAFQYERLSGGDITVINVVNIEDYAKGVVPYEMSASWPIEALKVEAVCARTYAIGNLKKHGDFDVCATIDCQVYQGTGLANGNSDAAVDQTAGQYLMYNGKLCGTYYSSSDGGATESSENVWVEAVPYLRGVIDPYEADIAGSVSGYSWTVTYTPAELTSRLKNKGYNVGNIISMAVTQYTDVGNVYKVTVKDDTGKTLSFTKGDTIRYALGLDSIRFTINGGSGGDGTYVNSGTTSITGGLSSYYAVGQSGIPALLGQNSVYAITGSGDTVAVTPGTAQQSTPGVYTIKGTGSGHNVGMSQWGAYSMAKYHNMTYDQILKFYYTGAVIG